MSRSGSQSAVSGRRRRRHWWERSLSRFIIALGVVLVLHLPMLLVKNAPEEKKETEEKLPVIGILPPDRGSDRMEIPAVSAWFYPGELSEWIRMMNPTRWYYPDDIEGFSRWGLSDVQHVAPALPEFVRVPLAVPTITVATAALQPDGEKVENYLRRDWREYVPEYPDLAYRNPDGKPSWRLRGGIQLKNPPELDDKALQQVAALRSKVVGVTRVEVQPLPGLSAPRVVLRKSCGVAALDHVAIRALRAYLLEKKAANAGKSVQIETDWQN